MENSKAACQSAHCAEFAMCNVVRKKHCAGRTENQGAADQRESLLIQMTFVVLHSEESSLLVPQAKLSVTETLR